VLGVDFMAFGERLKQLREEKKLNRKSLERN